MKEPFRVVVLHGARGGPDRNWFPWLRDALEAEGLGVVIPRLPTPDGQSLAAWTEAYDQAVSLLPPAATIFVGHSLGAAFALRLVERSTMPVAGLLLAAGFLGALGLPEYDPINASFFAAPFDWPAIRKRSAGVTRCWAGDDDPYVRLTRARELADLLEAELLVVRAGGHLNDETGFVTFPQMRNSIMNLIPK